MSRTKISGHKRPRGRPIEKPVAEPIPDSPENIARAILRTPRKRSKDWKYLEAKG